MTVTAPDADLRVVGQRLPKLDAPEKVTGRTRYADDLRIPGLLTAGILRSPHPHARILSIDTTAAEALPGVVAVIHAGNVEQRPFGYHRDNVPLKRDPVRCVGDEVAAVAAVDEETVREALRLIDVRYEELPAVFDPFEALAEDAPALHDELAHAAGNVAMRWDFDAGDVTTAERDAAVIVEGRYSSPLAAPAPIETHVIIASFDASGHLTVWSPVHMVFMYRKELADTLGLDWRRITIRQPPVGGSFGGKIDIDTHDFICVMLARAARRPVKLAMSREEEFTGHPHAPTHPHLAAHRCRRGREAALPRTRRSCPTTGRTTRGAPTPCSSRCRRSAPCTGSRTSASAARSRTPTRPTAVRCAASGTRRPRSRSSSRWRRSPTRSASTRWTSASPTPSIPATSHRRGWRSPRAGSPSASRSCGSSRGGTSGAATCGNATAAWARPPSSTWAAVRGSTAPTAAGR